jgi:methionyl-tRNA synthetase
VAYDRFIRTTDERHYDAVETVWNGLKAGGYIYSGKHEGWYSVSDETFFPESSTHMVLDPQTGHKMMVSSETGKTVEWAAEHNYHFRLSDMAPRLLSFYEQHPDFILPATRQKDMVDAVKSGLTDLSISRPSGRLPWGIPVPNDPEQTIYVWLDALVNYITASGYPWTPGTGHHGGWPADVHVIGKDIVRFHCIYWPAFLLALDLPLPKRVLAHAHWTMNRRKMSKSVGNVVNPSHALDRYGVDAMRFYLAHDGGIVDDGDYSNEGIVERYKKSLQDGLGNLAGRVRGKNFDMRAAVTRGVDKSLLGKVDAAQVEMLESLADRVAEKMQRLEVGLAIKETMNAIYEV